MGKVQKPSNSECVGQERKCCGHNYCSGGDQLALLNIVDPWYYLVIHDGVINWKDS
jgi:hypothetical protein